MNKNAAHKQRRLLQGFSLGELLVVIVIVTLLAITIIMTYQNQVAKANDAKRKEDLNKFKIAFEDYYNDNGCYPTSENMNTTWQCGSDDFAPYMDTFLCDPTTNKQYYYVQLSDCKGYKLYALLQNEGDPDIRNVGCWPVKDGGCGEDPYNAYNYGIAVGEPLVDPDYEPEPPVEESGASGGGGSCTLEGVTCGYNSTCGDVSFNTDGSFSSIDKKMYCCKAWCRDMTSLTALYNSIQVNGSVPEEYRCSQVCFFNCNDILECNN